MSRHSVITLIVSTVTLVGSVSAQAGCPSHTCPTHYGQYTAREAFVLFQTHPEFIKTFPQIAKQLETQFGAIQPAAVTPVGTNAAVAAPAVLTSTPAAVIPSAPAAIAAPPAATALTPAPVSAPPSPPVVQTPLPVLNAAPAVSPNSPVVNEISAPVEAAPPAVNAPPATDAPPAIEPPTPAELPAVTDTAAATEPPADATIEIADPIDLPSDLPLEDPPADA